MLVTHVRLLYVQAYIFVVSLREKGGLFMVIWVITTHQKVNVLLLLFYIARAAVTHFVDNSLVGRGEGVVKIVCM